MVLIKMQKQIDKFFAAELPKILHVRNKLQFMKRLRGPQ